MLEYFAQATDLAFREIRDLGAVDERGYAGVGYADYGATSQAKPPPGCYVGLGSGRADFFVESEDNEASAPRPWCPRELP
eukprot:7453274-Alexandrium_andersonii.AAC.1